MATDMLLILEKDIAKLRRANAKFVVEIVPYELDDGVTFRLNITMIPAKGSPVKCDFRTSRGDPFTRKNLSLMWSYIKDTFPEITEIVVPVKVKEMAVS